MSRFFITRPIFACVISIILVLLGFVAYARLPVAQYPELAPPVVRVEALYPGANAQVIADTVASPIEQQINGVDNMIYMSSTSSDGRYGLDVSFAPGVDVDLAAVLVQNRVNIAQAALPEEVRRLGITTRKQSTSMAGVISLSSPKGSVNDVQLSNFLATYWRDEIARIPGVGAINILPAKDYSMRIWLSPDALKARNLSINDVQAAIRAQNLLVPTGAIGRPPAPAGTDLEFIVTTQGRLLRPEEFENIILRTEGPGNTILLKDVARVELGSRDYSTISTFNSKPNAILAVYQLPGANLVEVADGLRAKLAQLNDPSSPLRASALLGPDVSAKFFYDSSMFIKASLEEVIKTLIEAFILVFLVVLLFLQSFRTTLIPALTIPVSLIGTFLLMGLFGFSINMLTMFGLVLAIGIVVDDAIVVVENVERNMTQLGLGAVEATFKAMGEITAPVIAITLVLMSVFLPTAALPGITGEMYRQFALTIAASTFLSALCALTLAPALCALLLKAHGSVIGGHAEDRKHAQAHSQGFILFRPFRWFGALFNRVFAAITRAYSWLIAKSLRFALVTLLLFAGTLALTLQLTRSVPTGFVPNEDLGFIVVAAQLPDGASLERTAAVIDRVSEQIQQVPGVEDVVTLSGFSVIQGQGTTYGNCWVVLKPWDERYKGPQPRSIGAIIGEINQRIAAVQEAQFLVFSLPAIPGIGNASGFDLRVQDRANQGRENLQQVVNETIAASFQQQGIAFTFTGYRAAVPQLFIDIDREKALALGITLESIYATLSASLGSNYVNDFNREGRTFQVTLQADAAYRLSREDILRFEVRNAQGTMVPLASFATIRDTMGPDRIERYNMYQTATINGIPAPGTSSGDAIRIMEAVANDKVVGSGMGYEWSGMSYQEKLGGGQAVLVFGLGLLLVYLILAALYESVTAPLPVILSVPLVVIGAMIALNYRGLDNNVFTQIGLVLLIGLGAKNAILIVEFARENRAAGKSIFDATMEAASTRFRPIIMTSLAFILGVVPLLNATGAGASSRRALGTAVFGGMVGATILGLFFIPVLYYVVQRIVEAIRPARS